MERVAVFVDAGYFWVQVCKTINGTYKHRREVAIDYDKMRQRFIQEVETQFPGNSFLRIYWYDGPGQHGKTQDHTLIDALDDVKLRLGSRNGYGNQKGVDGLIISDLINLTQQRAITSALVITGDADIAPGIVAAQSMGLRVHLLSIGSTGATSPMLSAEVDRKRAWDASILHAFVRTAPNIMLDTEDALQQSVPTMPAAVPVPVKTRVRVQKAVAGKSPFAAEEADGEAETAAPAFAPPHGFAEETRSANMARVAAVALEKIHKKRCAAALASCSQSRIIPAGLDGALLKAAAQQLGRQLSAREKIVLRDEFKTLVAREQQH